MTTPMEMRRSRKIDATSQTFHRDMLVRAEMLCYRQETTPSDDSPNAKNRRLFKVNNNFYAHD
jgi:hypothetical protein